VISLNNPGRDDDGPLSEEERRLLDKFRDCDNLVDWDDPADFSLWQEIFAKAFAPPPPEP
jgi:hypothetical protein